MKSFILVFALLFSFGCSTAKKVVEKAKIKAGEGISNVLVKELQCDAPEVVRNYVFDKLNLEAENGLVITALTKKNTPSNFLGSGDKSLGASLCTAAAALTIPALLSKGVPSDWKCRLTNVSGKLTELATSACAGL